MPNKPTSFREMVEVIDGLPTVLRMARRMRGLSLRGVAEESGISFNSLSRCERGGEMSTTNLRRLLVWLDDPPRLDHTEETP